ncbi:hypothetical protein L2E82_03036 [Cichorium intybus]|uniref:Uncharacterized protein n=1 Tax=Cichorium intybus TaxID=13427 RepID=A0ACB9H3T9_CICIN|nr:hypothetical protein L2E82_03036 [Cichorium intybus]
MKQVEASRSAVQQPEGENIEVIDPNLLESATVNEDALAAEKKVEYDNLMEKKEAYEYAMEYLRQTKTSYEESMKLFKYDSMETSVVKPTSTSDSSPKVSVSTPESSLEVSASASESSFERDDEVSS